MDIFTQHKWLKRTVVFLALLNLAILTIGAMMFSNGAQRPPRPDEGNDEFRFAAEFLRTELKLSPRQEQQLEEIRFEFNRKAHAIDKSTHNKRDSLIIAMYGKQIDTVLFNDLNHRLMMDASLMEQSRLEQARQIRKVLTPLQMAQFRDIFEEVKAYFRPASSRPPRR